MIIIQSVIEIVFFFNRFVGLVLNNYTRFPAAYIGTARKDLKTFTGALNFGTSGIEVYKTSLNSSCYLFLMFIVEQKFFIFFCSNCIYHTQEFTFLIRNPSYVYHFLSFTVHSFLTVLLFDHLKHTSYNRMKNKIKIKFDKKSG
jgi:branched-subunit amino acid transport protein